MKLTPKQKAFAEYYIETGNATESAIKAGYSQNTARVIGQENLLKPAIKSYIDEKMKELESKRIAKAEEVLEYLTKSPNTSVIPYSFCIKFFSATPVVLAAITCIFLGDSATININFSIPTVVFPAAVVPSNASTGALCFKKAKYLSDNLYSLLIIIIL